jgi:FliI/YscN family ATPase
VGDELMGQVLNGVGEPMRDGENLDGCRIHYPVMAPPPDPLKRERVSEAMSVGVRAIDGFLTCGKGQRVGIFAGAGVGKSTLLGMIARNSEADVNVIALVGERGREVRDFLEGDLGPEGLRRSVVVCATSDQPSLVRLKAAYVATAIAEYFRDCGRKVVFMMDSVTRFARAQREIGLACGEPPARAGYTPSVFTELPRLLERTGNSDRGSITAFYTVLVAGGDMSEPVADEVKSILDCHIVLSPEVANRRRFPAIDVLDSVSRVMSQVTSPAHQARAAAVNEAVALFQKNRDAIALGAYKPKTNPALDKAIGIYEKAETFARQDKRERTSLDDALEGLTRVLG